MKRTAPGSTAARHLPELWQANPDFAGAEILLAQDGGPEGLRLEDELRRFGFRHLDPVRGAASLFPDNKTPDLALVYLGRGAEDDWRRLEMMCERQIIPVLAVADAERTGMGEKLAALDVPLLDLSKVGYAGLRLKIEAMLATSWVGKLKTNRDRAAHTQCITTLTVMVRALESKDPYTRHHSHSVAKWSRMIGRRANLGDAELERLGLAAMLHDFGKVGIPESILTKKERLNDEEFEIMKRHPVIACELLSPLEIFQDLLPAIMHHHERWDGSGYPRRLSGDAIPLWARIISVADAYDTMAGRRSYKNPYSLDRIIGEIERGSGGQFDPTLAEILLTILNERQS